MKKKNLIYLVAFVATATLGFGQTTYTWTGAADPADGDWTNAANWDANGIPEDNYPDVADADSLGLTMPVGSKIVFNAATVPTSGIPKLGGDLAAGGVNRDTPSIELLQGGAIDFGEISGRDGSVWINAASSNPTVFVVGDGTGAAGEVELSIGSKVANLQLARHNNNIFSFVVNSDGILNFTSGSVDFGNSDSRVAQITIDGGEVNFSGVITDMATITNAVVDFTAIGGELTASFGGNFANIGVVQASIGVDFIESYGGTLLAVDNTDGTFTVSAIALQNPIKWTGTGGATWDQSTTTNFSTNAAGGTLTEDTFANALAGSTEIVTFADEYEHDTGPTAVTQTTVTIDAAGVSAPINGIEFSNNSMSYDVGTSGTTGITGATSVAVNGGGTVTLSGPNTHTATTTVTGSTLILADELALQNSTLNTDIAPEFDQSVGGNAFTLGGLAGSGNVALENNAGVPASIQLTIGNSDSDAPYSGSLSGAGSLIKVGTGSSTLSAANTYSGGTTINDGALVVGNNGALGSGSLTLVGGALQLLGSASSLSNAINVTGSSSIASGGNLTLGTGAITGSGTLSFGFFDGAGVASVTLSNGVLDGFTGTISHVADDTVGAQNNLMLIGHTTTATLNTTGDVGGERWVGINGNTEVGELTGDGGQIATFNTGAGATLTINQSTDTTYGGLLGAIAANRPLAINKTGSGTLTLTNTNTYRGNTTVDGGTLTIADGGGITFVPGADTVTTQALGTGTLNLNGEIFFDLGGADETDGNTWLIVDVVNLTESYGGTFSVNSSAGAFTNSLGTWTLTDGVNDWTFEQSTGELSLAVTASPFDTWATGSETFDGDGNGDGVLDGLAFLLGATDPSVDANALLPTVSEDGSGNLVLTFSMLNAANRGTASLATQHSSDLGATDAWDAAGNEETVPETTSTVGVVDFDITINAIDSSLNDVIATIPGSEGASGKLFGRLEGTEAP